MRVGSAFGRFGGAVGWCILGGGGFAVGGFAIGLLETLVSAAGLSVWKDGVVFAILILVLLVKPTGILGRKITEKV